MFIKINPSKNYKYVQLVRAYRQDGKVKHETLFNLGRLDQIENNPDFQKIFMKLAQLAGAHSMDLSSCSEAQMMNWGYIVYKKLWEKFRLNDLLSQLQKSHGKTQFNLNNACFLMSIQHLLSPTSKLGSYQAQSHYACLPEVGLNHLYRSLDILSQEKEAIESHLFQMNRDLFNMQVDVVFYDVTTFHFESVQQDSLREFGFSKNAKFNEVQVVLGMLVDREGRPVGYELFPGNTFEGKTLEKALHSIDKRFGIRNVILVADRGINSKLNLKQIKDKNYGYIVASRIKNMPKEVQEEIFKEENYKTLSESETEGKVRYKVIDFINQFKMTSDENEGDEKRKCYQVIELEEKLIITHSTKRARKDKLDRERLLEKANYLLQEKSRITSSNKRGGKKYLKEVSHTDWRLDTAAVSKDEKWDGYYGIQTSEKDFSVEKILAALHSLWRIEICQTYCLHKNKININLPFLPVNDKSIAWVAPLNLAAA